MPWHACPTPTPVTTLSPTLTFTHKMYKGVYSRVPYRLAMTVWPAPQLNPLFSHVCFIFFYVDFQMFCVKFSLIVCFQKIHFIVVSLKVTDQSVIGGAGTKVDGLQRLWLLDKGALSVPSTICHPHQPVKPWCRCLRVGH